MEERSHPIGGGDGDSGSTGAGAERGGQQEEIRSEKRRKSNFDVMPDALHGSSFVQGSVVSIPVQMPPPTLPAVAFPSFIYDAPVEAPPLIAKDAAFCAKLSSALSRTFAYIERKDAMAADMSAACPDNNAAVGAAQPPWSQYMPAGAAGTSRVQEQANQRIYRNLSGIGNGDGGAARNGLITGNGVSKPSGSIYGPSSAAPGAGSTGRGANCSVYVSGLPWDIEEADLGEFSRA